MQDDLFGQYDVLDEESLLSLRRQGIADADVGQPSFDASCRVLSLLFSLTKTYGGRERILRPTRY